MVSPELVPVIVPLLAALALGTVIYVFAYPYLSGEKKAEKRISGVTENRAARIATKSADDVAATRRQAVSETLKGLEDQQKAKAKLTLRLRLQRAGLEAEPRSFWIASVICGLICAALGFFAIPSSSVQLIAVGSIGFIGALGLPRWFLNKMIKRRQLKFQTEMANSIDVIVRGIKSGLPLNECLQIISRESPDPIAGEFKEVVEQQRIGVSLAEALDRLIQRMPLAEVKFLAIVIAIQQQAGGNLSEALSNLSSVLRERFKIKMKVQALAAEAKSSAAVLASLPPGVLFMLHVSTPEYISPMFTTLTGNLILGAGLTWMGIGCLIMRKMINFKF